MPITLNIHMICRLHSIYTLYADYTQYTDYMPITLNIHMICRLHSIYTWYANYTQYTHDMPIPVAAQPIAWVLDRSLAGIAGSNPAAGMDVCLFWVFFFLVSWGLCVGLITRPEESYRVWCVWVWSLNLKDEVALAHWGLLVHGEKIHVT